MTTESRVTGGVAYQTGYAYDPATGDLSGMTYPSGLTLDFQYDANGRVSGVSSGGQTLIGNVAYKPFGPVKSMNLGPLALTRTYDQRYQVTGIQAGTVLNYGYTHDGAGNVETISGLPKPDLTPRQTDVAYTGNRLTSIDTLWTIPHDYPTTGTSYAYDNAGNIVSDGLHTGYFYNQNNRLIRVEIDGRTVAEYAYDAFERRVMKVVNGVTTHFHYDLNGLLTSETDGNGNPRRDYVYLNGEPVAMKVYGGSAGWYWFVNDHLGTPQKMVDAAGTVVWAAAYAPFGEARVYQDEITNNLRFPGQYYDVETGLHYNWHRYYDPGTGRYLRADPIGLAGGVNLYIYASNDPINAIDFLGLFSESQKRAIRDAWRNTGSTAGAILGFIGGGGGGSLTGPGALVTAPAGAYVGAAVGSVVGGTAGQAAADFVMNMMEGDGDGDPCEEETPRRVTNPKHHPNSKSPEPENVQELFARSLVDKKGVRWAKDSDGIIHRFSRPINGETHWNGSTGGHKPIRIEDIPVKIRRALR